MYDKYNSLIIDCYHTKHYYIVLCTRAMSCTLFRCPISSPIALLEVYLNEFNNYFSSGSCNNDCYIIIGIIEPFKTNVLILAYIMWGRSLENHQKERVLEAVLYHGLGGNTGTDRGRRRRSGSIIQLGQRNV